MFRMDRHHRLVHPGACVYDAGDNPDTESKAAQLQEEEGGSPEGSGGPADGTDPPLRCSKAHPCFLYDYLQR